MEVEKFGKIKKLLYVRSFHLANYLLHLNWRLKCLIFQLRKSEISTISTTPLLPEAFVINLSFRKDRLEEITRTLEVCGLGKWQRIEAIANLNGALGCALSHKIALKAAAESKGDVFLVLEDDVVPSQFFHHDYFLRLLSEFYQEPKFAVMCLAFSSDTDGVEVSDYLRLDDDIATTATYVVKRSFIPYLQCSFGISSKLLELGVANRLAAIDIHWKLIQKHIFFVRPVNPLFVQKPGWSNIENRTVEYS